MKHAPAAGLAALVLFAVTTLADGPVHIQRTVTLPPIDAPAGTICDFAYHQEATVTLDIKRFLDDAGNIVRVVRTEIQDVVHQNADTGYTLTEQAVIVVRLDDFVNGVPTSASVSGNSWHLVDSEGNLVLVRAGRTTLVDGEITTITPNANEDFAELICTALGGAPAS
jgi:hypothetical protein